MIGIVKSSLPDAAGMGPIAALQAAHGLGFKGLLFNSLFDISPGLDPAELQAVRAEADRLGLFISASLGVVNPVAPARGTKLVEAGNGDMTAGVKWLIGLAADIGILDMFFVIGMIEDRFQTNPTWQAQRDGVAKLIRDCGPLLRSRGAKLLLKTHEELLTSELLDLVDSVGSDLLGVAFDPVNVLCRLEEPMAAAGRVAPHAASIHVDNAILRYEENGFRRYLASIDEGVLRWDALLPLMPKAHIWVEMHSGQFAMPVFDQEWLAAQPGANVEELAALMAMARNFGTNIIPWDQASPTDRLPQAIGKFLK